MIPAQCLSNCTVLPSKQIKCFELFKQKITTPKSIAKLNSDQFIFKVFRCSQPIILLIAISLSQISFFSSSLL